MKQYLPRHIERQLKLLARHCKVVLVTGARQSGKSTLLTHVFSDVKHIVFDPIQDLFSAREDPDFFLDHYPSPLILDEVQYAPELLAAIKRKVDRSESVGQYFLTGSQNFGLLRTISESLAGRVGVLSLQNMTLSEMNGTGDKPSWLEWYVSHPQEMFARSGKTISSPRLFETLWRGGFPGLLGKPSALIPNFLQSYLQTYVERDVRLLEEVREMGAFGRFLGLLGALSAQEINHSQIGRDVGINPGTARNWLELLQATFQWFELPAYHGNAIKRLSGKRKGYLSDTGLACYLQKVSSPDALGVSPLLGPMFETWVVGSIRKLCSSLSVPPNLYHWRTGGGAEVDLVLERDGFLFPIEVKCKTRLSGHDIQGIRAFRDTYGSFVQPGLIIYAGSEVIPLSDFCHAIPWNIELSQHRSRHRNRNKVTNNS